MRDGGPAPARPHFLRRRCRFLLLPASSRAVNPPWSRWRPFQTRQPVAAGGNDGGSCPPLAGTGSGVKQGRRRRPAGPGALGATPQRPASEGFALVSLVQEETSLFLPPLPASLPGERGARPRGERHRGCGRAPRAKLGRDSWKDRETMERCLVPVVLPQSSCLSQAARVTFSSVSLPLERCRHI